MKLPNECRRRSVLTAIPLLCAALLFAQPATVSPVRTVPTEKLTVKPGFRDWGPVTIVGTTILGGNQTNRGGLYAIDAVSGCAFRPS